MPDVLRKYMINKNCLTIQSLNVPNHISIALKKCRGEIEIERVQHSEGPSLLSNTLKTESFIKKNKVGTALLYLVSIWKFISRNVGTCCINVLFQL